VSAVGTALTNLMTHVMHGVFLLACLYVAFDPAFSPRRLGGGYALLPFYYLGALSIGYFSGYFLMVFAGGNEQSVWRRSPPIWRKGVFFVLRGLVWVALVGVPAGLVWQNLPKVRVNSSDALNRLGELTAQALPPQGAVVLSDDLPRLYAVQATLAQQGTADKYLFVQTKALLFQAYHRYLRRTYGTRWPLSGLERPPGLQVDDPTLLEALDQVSRSRDLYYLHPSFGYYFERFYSQPHHLVYRLARYPTNVIEAPLPAAEALQENDRFWQQLRGQELTRIIKSVKKDKPKQAIEPSAAWLGMIYSRSANYLGVEYQRSGNLAKAAEYFALGLDLNPDSPICYINAEFNKRLRAGRHEALAPDEEITRRIAAYQGDWNTLLTYNGPVDEPNSCYLLGQTLAGGGNNRQSAQQYLRVLAYEPENFETRITLAATLATQFPDQALETLAQTRALVAGKPAATNDALALLQLEAWAYAAKNDLARAEKILLEAQVQYPKNAGPFSTLAEIYVNSGRTTNAMMVLEKQLSTLPEDANTLANYAALKIRAGKLNDAIPYLDKALKLEPRHPYALLNRAIAFLQIGKADDAERDYSTLERLLAKPPYAVYYGLGEVARLKKNRKEALKYYEQFIQRAPPGAPEINYVREQIQLIKSGKK
jgi:tetratricopeptide (TPR) repeat protein